MQCNLSGGQPWTAVVDVGAGLAKMAPAHFCGGTGVDVWGGTTTASEAGECLLGIGRQGAEPNRSLGAVTIRGRVLQQKKQLEMHFGTTKIDYVNLLLFVTPGGGTFPTHPPFAHT